MEQSAIFGQPVDAFASLKAGARGEPPFETLERVSSVLGIYRALYTIPASSKLICGLRAAELAHREVLLSSSHVRYVSINASDVQTLTARSCQQLLSCSEKFGVPRFERLAGLAGLPTRVAFAFGGLPVTPLC